MNHEITYEKKKRIKFDNKIKNDNKYCTELDSTIRETLPFLDRIVQASSIGELKMKTYIKIIAFEIIFKNVHLNAYSQCEPKTVAFHISNSNAKWNSIPSYLFIELSGIVE